MDRSKRKSQEEEKKLPREELQEKVLGLLENDPQAAMALMVEQYTGLIWSIAKQYLADPEDIKECVNDVFVEFYCHRERFDRAKGSLEAFLAGIAKNKAISRYRKNRANEAVELAEEAAGGADEIGRLEEKLDLEKALAELKPEDAKILRMKYYDGMSVWEIAESLGLPYETVKKRHQRGLAKLRLNFIASLLLVVALFLALAACAYAVLQYFGVIPGYGVNTSQGNPVYQLTEQTFAKNEAGEFLLQDALLAEGRLWLYGTNYFYEEIGDDFWKDRTEEAQLYYNGSVYSCYCSYNCVDPTSYKIAASFEQLPMPPAGEEVLELKLLYQGKELHFCLELAKENRLEDYSYAFGERGGLLAIPRLEGGELIIGLYPLSAGDATVLPGILRGIYMEGKSGEMTALSPDGNQIVGEMLYNSPFSGSFSEWNFGIAEPGEYVLHIPYVFLSLPIEPFSIPINLETCEWEEREYPLPSGSLSVAGCERLELAAGEAFEENRIRAEEGWSYWLVSLRCRMEEDLEPSMLLGEYRPQESGQEEAGKTGISLLEARDGNLRYLVRAREGFDLTQYSLYLSGEMSVKWLHAFEIKVMAEEEE